MLWFTSDPHINHENIIRYVPRPFANVQEMNEIIVTNINEKVRENDTLWILGDVAMGRDKLQTTADFLSQLACDDIHLILGNHDPRNRIDDLLACGFKTVSDYEEIRLGSKRQNAVLSHYPMASWNGRNHGSYMLHGHIHALPEYNVQNRENGYRRYDVGVDANGYSPVSAEDIIKFFDGMEVKSDIAGTLS